MRAALKVTGLTDQTEQILRFPFENATWLIWMAALCRCAANSIWDVVDGRSARMKALVQQPRARVSHFLPGSLPADNSIQNLQFCQRAAFRRPQRERLYILTSPVDAYPTVKIM